MEKYGFIYIWYDTNHKKYYIGSHWGQINDRYICSSKWMKKAYKNRPSEFKRRILESGIKKNKLKANEYRWLSMIKDEELGKRYYNLNNKKILKPGNWPTGRTRSEETKQKISEALKGNTPWNKGVPMSNDQKEKLRLINLGKGHSEDTKKRVSLSLIGNKRRSGKLHSTEDLEKMSKSQKKIWDNNSERKKQQSIRMKQYWENYRNRKKENNE